MEPGFEPVVRVDDYYDGVREGIAQFHGVPHHFGWLGWELEGWQPDEDRYRLTPLPPAAGEVVIARGEFRTREPIPDLPPGELRPQEVRWQAESPPAS